MHPKILYNRSSRNVVFFLFNLYDSKHGDKRFNKELGTIGCVDGKTNGEETNSNARINSAKVVIFAEKQGKEMFAEMDFSINTIVGLPLSLFAIRTA